MKTIEATSSPYPSPSGSPSRSIDPLWSRYMDDPVVRPLLPAFAKALAERVALMNVMVGGGDAVEVARIAHMIRGAAGSYGYAQVAQLAGQIETGARGGSKLADVGPLVGELARMSEGVTAAVAAMDAGASEWNRGFRDEGGVD